MIKTWLAGLCALAVLTPLPAMAKEDDKTVARPEIYQQISACRAITDPEERLKCYDRSTEQFVTAVEDKSLVVLDKQEVQKTRRSLFGFSLPKLPFFSNDNEKGEDKDAFTEITTKIAAARPAALGHWQIKIEEGAWWETTESMVREPEPGDEVNIRQAALGSYFLKLNGSRAVRAKRIE